MTDCSDPPTILILGGTAEARELAGKIRVSARYAVRQARDLDDARGVSAAAIIDARHPFAPGVINDPAPILRLWRPEWQAGPGDNWISVADGRQAVELIPNGATVFVATGRGRLGELAGLSDRTVWWRRRGVIEAPFPFDAGGWLTEEGPFSEAEEHTLFSRLGVDWLILQNAGGQGAFPKLAAARRLGVSVAMIQRPPRSDPAVSSIAEALDWIRTLFP